MPNFQYLSYIVVSDKLMLSYIAAIKENRVCLAIKQCFGKNPIALSFYAYCLLDTNLSKLTIWSQFFFSFTGVKCIHFYFPKRFGKITVPLFWNRKSLTRRRNTLQASVPLQAVCGTATTRKDRLSVHITPPLLGKMKELQTALGFINVKHRHICRSAVFGFTDKKKNWVGPFKL